MRRLLNRLAKPVALLVIAAQLLLGLPAMANAHIAVSSGTHVPCDEMATTHHDGCPCCPDDSGSLKDCLAMCSLAAAVTPSAFVLAVTRTRVAALVEVPDVVSTLADPPLKPPPIA